MQPKNIMRYIRISQLKRIVYPLVFLVIVFLIFFSLPLSNYLNVTDVDAGTPLSSSVNRQETYVRTTASDLYYTGDDYYLDGVLTGHFYYQLSDGYCRIYILKPAAGKPAAAYIEKATITGKIVKYGSVSDAMITDFAETLGWTPEGLSNLIDPYAINEAYYFPPSQIVLGVLTIIMMIIGLIRLLYILTLLAFPKLSVTYLRLKGYGNAGEILADAEKELRRNCILEQENMALTPKYLFEFSSDLSAIIPLESVLWVFPLENLKYSFREHREKMNYILRIITIAGDTFILKNKRKADIDKIIEVLTDRYPNFFYGYSEDHDNMVHYILEENRKELREKRRKKQI